MPRNQMNRRDFLLVTAGHRRVSLVLSGERLYMRYVDSRLEGTTSRLFEELAEELRRADEVQLVEPAWVAAGDLYRQLEPLLAAFRSRGGRMVCHQPVPGPPETLPAS